MILFLRTLLCWRGHKPGYCGHKMCPGNCRCLRCGAQL